MKELFASYTQAKELKDLGFDEPCFATFNMENVPSGFPNEDMAGEPVEPLGYAWQNSKIHRNTITAPLKQQVFSWFRKKHNLFDVIERITEKEFSYFIYDHSLIKTKEYCILDKGKFVLTYEQAESECIDKLISILKEKQCKK